MFMPVLHEVVESGPSWCNGTFVFLGERLDHAVVTMFRKGKKRHSSSSSQSSEISTKSKVGAGAADSVSAEVHGGC